MSEEKKKICFFTAYYYPHIGGVERYTHYLSMALLKYNYDITIVTFNTEDEASEEVISENIKIYRLPVFAFSKKRFPILKFNALYRSLIKKIVSVTYSFFITQTRFYFSTFLAQRLAKKNHKDLIVIDHGSGHMQMNNFIFNRLGAIYEHAVTRFIKRENVFFFGVSARVVTWLKHFNIEASGILYNAVDTTYTCRPETILRDTYNLPQDALLISFAGRLIPEKGIRYLCNAFVKLSEKHPHVFLFIAGDGPLMQEIKEAYKSDKIFILGSLPYDNVMQLLNETDVVVIPSYYPEGLPTLLLEAGMCKCAVITTLQGGTSEVLTDDSMASVVEPRSENELCFAMEKLIKDARLRETHALNLHNRVKQSFGWEHTALVLNEFLKAKTE